MRRLLGSLLGLAIYLGSPCAFASAEGSEEEIWLPLVGRAEADLREGRPELARARAEAVLQAVPRDSNLATLAGSLAERAYAAQRSTGAPLSPPEPGIVYAPLVEQAEEEAASGKRELASARLGAALQALPPNDPLAKRARNLRMVLAQAGGGAAAAGQTPIPEAPSATVPTAPGAYAGGGGGAVVSGQAAQPPAPSPAEGSGGSPAASVDTPSDPERRSSSELTELYTGALGFGAFAGISLLVLSDVEEPLLYLPVPIVTGLALGGLVKLLDKGSGFRAGIPSAITTGAALGLGNGIAIWGALDSDLNEEGVLGLLLAATTAGTLAGGLVGFGLRPSVAENRLALSSTLWGGFVGAMGALAFEPRSEIVWRSTLLGAGCGTVASMLAGSLLDVSIETVAAFNGAVGTGALAGLMVAGFLHLEADRDGRSRGSETTTAALAIGSGVGFGLGLLVIALDNDDAKKSSDEKTQAARSALPALRVAPAPVAGGALMTASLSL